VDIQKLIENIKNEHDLKKYTPSITQIRLPHFKNLDPKTQINFSFPLMALVGQNGSGKSSVLHAIYGLPDNYSISKKWFSTIVDPISETPRSTVIYSYDDGSKEEKEVIYQRAPKGDEYWETRKPLKMFGMDTSKRSKPVDKNVIDLDFRSMLSAFDKYFYFETPRKRTKQQYLRDKSGYLNNIFEHKPNHIYIRAGKKRNDKRIDFKPQEIHWINKILNKEYTAAYLVRHRLYKNWGYSIKFHTKDLKYSEAFAGSGEMATAILVHKIVNAPKKSLILLDEPEVSLHPGAQKELQYFLVDQINKNKHQIIMSTHSPALIKNLPIEAIKVFVNSENGTFKVLNDVPHDKAFSTIGATSGSLKTIYVEDSLAQKLVRDSLNIIDEEVSKKINIIPLNGEAGLIKSLLTRIDEDNIKNVFYLFDGDVKDPEFDLPPLSTIASGDLNQTKLQQCLSKITKNGTNLKFPYKSRNEPEEVNIVRLKKLWNFITDGGVQYLPFETPEESIWNDDSAENILAASGCASIKKIISDLKKEQSYKHKFDMLTQETTLGHTAISGAEIQGHHDTMIRNWRSSNDCKNLTEVLNKIVHKINESY
jgi:predicted ATPase